MRSRILFVAGLALFWSMLRNSFFGAFFAGSATVLVPGLFYASLCAIAVLAWLRPSAVAGALLTNRWALGAICGAGSALLLLCAVSGSLAITANAVVPVAALVNGACIAVLAIGWAAAARYDADIRPRLLPLLGWSFFFSFLAMSPSLVNSQLTTASWILFPALSGVAWILVPSHTNKTRLLPKERLPLKGFPLLWVVAAFMLLSGLLIGLYDSGFVAYNSDHDNLRYYFSLLFSLALVPCLYAVRRNSHLRLIIWSAVLLIVFAGAFFAVPFTGGHNARWDVLMAGRTALWALYWSLLIEVSHKQRLSTVAIIGLFFLLARGISSLGIEVVSLFQPAMQMSEQTALFLTLLVVFMLVVCMFLFIWLGTSSNMEGTVEGAKAEPAASPAFGAPEVDLRENACEQIRQEFDLTERETEVLSMLSRGYTTKRMAEELFVSDNTVRSHVKSLYRKTDLHSRQDAIDFVNDRMA